jgi:hypothetical protein
MRSWEIVDEKIGAALLEWLPLFVICSLIMRSWEIVDEKIGAALLEWLPLFARSVQLEHWWIV